MHGEVQIFDAAASKICTFWVGVIVLRLLTNQTVMGKDTLNPDEAWLTWEKLILDERAAFLPLESSGIDSAWKRNIAHRAPTPKLWMDAYLAAWADTAGLAFVTFDSGFRSFRLKSLEILRSP